MELNKNIRSSWTRLYLGTIAWSVFVLYLCTKEPSSLPKYNWLQQIPYLDKWAHFIFHFTFVFIFSYELKKNNFYSFRRKLLFLVPLLTSVSYGAGIEILQKFVFTYRSASFGDLLSNILGALIATLLFRKFISNTNNSK